jgi:lipoic acid synthetase
VKVEVLIPDFQGDTKALKTVMAANPYVLNHNLETVPRLYSSIRPQADYKRSLKIIKEAKKLAPQVYTKSGFMVGLGETDDEVLAVLEDLKAIRCNTATIGQYLPPSSLHLPAIRYVVPEIFNQYVVYGEKIGLKVTAGPFVRSSFQAKQLTPIIHAISVYDGG